MTQVVCTINSDVTIESHATDNTKVIIRIGGTDYTVDATDILQAVHNCINI